MRAKDLCGIERASVLAWIILGGLITAHAAEPKSEPGGVTAGENQGIRCKIDNQEISFGDRARATATDKGGVLLTGHAGKGCSLMIQLPKLRVGVQKLSETPQLQLHYSRSLYSSDSRDHFAATAGTRESALQVEVKKVDETARVIEGAFSAFAVSSPSGRAMITNGTFRLKIEAPLRGQSKSSGCAAQGALGAILMR